MSSHGRRAELASLIGVAQARYVREIDDGDCTKWPDFFTDDCFYKITSVDNYAQNLEAGLVWLDSKEMLRDRILSLLEANVYERHAYRHLLGQPFVGEPEGGEVDAETAFMVARITREGPTDLFATGRYIDRYRVVGDEVKLVTRVVVLDSNHIDTLIGFPL